MPGIESETLLTFITGLSAILCQRRDVLQDLKHEIDSLSSSVDYGRAGVRSVKECRYNYGTVYLVELD